MTTEALPAAKRRRRPAAASRVLAAGLSAAAALGLIGRWGMGEQAEAQQTTPVVGAPTDVQPTIIVRIVRRRAAIPAPRTVRRIVRAAHPSAPSVTRTRAS